MSYLPQWKARLAAVALLGESGKAWTKGGRCHIGLRLRNGSKVALGSGADWQAALDQARRNSPK